ncbi:MSHA biogenesis protein MshJ [Vibrio sp. 10N.286.49.B3]|uniref:type 4a pilus biogenesis protein PilO n=1 Tax=Vibrio sp. 10N.286.49.B3 TaxID=1880855 RepID=UPI000C860F68|nr:type 4a pilus biogenesis protein PilO [Vibrio sp. 10N.286.49.B3]PMH39895.1 MSHA biogenesis protein MshJ [Vibrio sp. 10N.286.49.B3]
MNDLWLSMNEKFSALSTREKWLIALSSVVGVFFLLLTFVVEPVIERHQQQQKRQQSLTLSNQKLEAEVLLMQAKLKKDPNQAINVEFADLMLLSQDLSEELSEVVESLISPSEMAALLESVLVKGKGLKLVSLESLKAEPIADKKQTSEYSGYFVHPVRIELTGGYFAISEYLQKLEALPVKYYWRSFHYSVESYPQARLILQVYTLGTRQEFIGG